MYNLTKLTMYNTTRALKERKPLPMPKVET